ncbi:MAG TPA: methionine aminotransferase [Ferruginibacter sp.]|nr:methionine aminotransferase [Ferruginibacter sp.]HMP19779.1 methionine aminotransferase [Ferruginibacter sp.]
MKPFITSKLPHTGTTIFTEMSALAAEYNAINLGQGFPDFRMDEALVELVNTSMQNGHNQYVHMNGLPLLRQRIAEKAALLYNATINPDTEITITPGATYAIYTAFTTVLQPGDEVILFEPAFDSYIPNIVINGGIPVPVSLNFPGYSINWDIVRQKISSRTKVIILNTPNNPTGSVLSPADWEQLRDIVKDTGIFIFSDEVYEHIIFDDIPHQSLLRHADLLQRGFVFFSFGKTYHCTGWKMGYCIAPAALMKEYRKVHQFNCFTTNSPVQYALAEFMLQQDKYLQLGKQLQQKRDYFQQRMQQTIFKPLPSSGSYFQLYSYAHISAAPERQLAIRLTKDYGVTAIPVASFYSAETNHAVLRFCFAKNENTLDEAAKRLAHFKG